jgi:hypothetical protein
MLNLGRTHNQLKDDEEAIKWFEMAAYSADPSIAGEAIQATRNLKPALQRIRITAWTLPFYSSRWKNTFTYGQVKADLRLGQLPFRPYITTRFVGDTKGTIEQPYPQYLSETAFIFGTGIATRVYKGLMGWAEAGLAVSYLNRSDQTSRTRPDYRAGASYSRGWGRLLGSKSAGLFWENHEDAVWVSRFDNTVLFYSQNKLGITFPLGEQAAIQLYWNGNLTVDTKRQYWANFADTGPGIRMRAPGMPPGMYLSIDLLRGAHLINEGNPRRPNYTDVRAGVWYALTR